MISNKKVLVTGGCGFIGSHLCDALLTEDNTVICIDNLFTGSLKNIEHLKDHKNFTFINHDVTIPIDLDVDIILNFACPASPVHYQKHPVETVRTNVMGTLNMLDLAKQKNALFFQASTSEVYGDPLVHPQHEGYWGNVNPIGKRSCYDEGKRLAETLAFDYHREYNVDIKVIRIFNTYGPRMSINDGRVVSNFIVQALEKQPLTLFGEGYHTRSFCYITDLIKGIELVLESELTGPINLGNPQETSVKALSELILELTNSKSSITYLPLPEDDPVQRKPDIQLAKQQLNWSPKIGLREGLNETIDFFKNLKP
jgi:UDP-glucuronate decarboxylase